MSTFSLIASSVLLLFLGGVISLVLARNRRLAGWISVGFVTAAAVGLWVAVARTFAAGVESERSLLAITELGASFVISLDPLSAFFVAIAATIAVLSTLYSVEYMTQFEQDSVAKYYPVLLLFFAAIVGVLVSHDFLFFLVFWEAMTLTSFFLVTFERESKTSQRAGLKYFLITHAATLCMVVAVLVLWKQTGSFHFSELSEALGELLGERPAVAHVVLALFFVGFATKAGILPMGDWLPDAHPAAPSGVSAALSGVLVKLGIYGLVRIFVSMLPVSRATDIWGVVLALAGTASLFIGTLTALKQKDSKRLMAFHTIGQIGYVCLGLGVGVACLRTHPNLAALGLLGALFHAANHACFKSCLFLGAGSVLYRTGHRDMNKLGGLARFMPVTAGSSTVASLAIAGVPPFNGFASKWLILCTCILAGMEFPLYLILGLVGMFISLGTLASFLKLLGGVFLGPADESRRVSEVPAAMAVPQIVLAALCVLLGVFPQLPLRFIESALVGIWQAGIPSGVFITEGPWSVALLWNGAAVAFWAPLVIALILAFLTMLAYAVQRAGTSEVKTVPVWTCGEEHESEAIRYPASSFYLPFKRAFEEIYPKFPLRVPRFPSPVRRVFDVDTWLYLPIVRHLHRGANAFARTHVGIPQVYLLWIVIGAIIVLAIVLTAG